MAKRQTIRLNVNGISYERAVEPRMLLVDFIRHELGLKGTHIGCEQGICGACTVILNGESVNSYSRSKQMVRTYLPLRDYPTENS